MATTMVTARIDEAKKIRGNAIFKKCGKTPSAVINELYDFVIRENALPWKVEQTGISTMSEQEIEDAKNFLHSIQIENSRFAKMSDEDIKRERMLSKGLT